MTSVLRKCSVLVVVFLRRFAVGGYERRDWFAHLREQPSTPTKGSTRIKKKTRRDWFAPLREQPSTQGEGTSAFGTSCVPCASISPREAEGVRGRSGVSASGLASAPARAAVYAGRRINVVEKGCARWKCCGVVQWRVIAPSKSSAIDHLRDRISALTGSSSSSEVVGGGKKKGDAPENGQVGGIGN